HADGYKAVGDPFVAVSSRIDDIDAACRLAIPRSRVVIVDGVRRITDLSKFDSISDRQSIILIADSEDEESLRNLYERGCRFWRFSAADLENGSARGQDSFFRKIQKAARNREDLRLETFPCENELLEVAARGLEMCQRQIEQSE